MAIPWLKELEERVRETAARMKELKTENESLKARVAELEEGLASASDASRGKAWSEEKAEIRQRVEKLADHLEKLLQDG